MKNVLIRSLSMACLLVAGNASAVTGYYRDPSLHGPNVVFASEGDLWLASINGGDARRLTSHPAREAQPVISGDGTRIAFAADYDGANEVYVMPLAGGTPRRLSFENGTRVLVQGWTPQGEVLYATDQRVGPTWQWTLHAVHPETLERREIPLADAREATFDDQGRLLFVRFGLGVTLDNAREYRGGAAGQLWRFAPGSAEAERLAGQHVGTLSRPMWWQGRILAISDADGAGNLWSFDADGGDARQLTFHKDFEVRGARLHDGQVVYQLGADIARLDLASGKETVLPLQIASDTASRRQRWLEKPLEFLDSANLSADGQRVVLTARGQAAVAGTGTQRRVELPLPAASRARNAVASADGRSIFAVIDASGEHEIWRFAADGSGNGEALTRDGHTQRGQLVPSPDGRWLAHDDHLGNLWLLDLRSGRNLRIDHSDTRSFDDIVWSPDSQAVVLVRPDSGHGRNQIVLHSLADGRNHVLTSDRYESFAPAFSADGKWLYFLSNRDFQATPGAPWGDRNMGPMFDRRTRLYALALQPGNRFPLQPRDELVPAASAAGAEKNKENGKGEDQGARRPAIVLEGLASRLHEAPVASGNYTSLAVGAEHLYLLERGPRQDAKPVLKSVAIDSEQPKMEIFAEDVASFALSSDGKQVFARMQGPAPGSTGELFILPAKAVAPMDRSQYRVRVGDWRLAVDPRLEWQQMFSDAWRMQRDYLFDPNMRGQDWTAIAAKYQPLVERVGERSELDDLLAQMVAELGVLHSQVRGGEYRQDPERAVPASLGARFERAEGGARVAHVYRTDPEQPNDRAPLARPGVELRAGDVVTAINGRPVAGPDDIALRLAHQAGQQVRIDYRRAGRAATAVAIPVNMEREAALRYSDWVIGRREAVEAASGGRIGYLHLYAMGPNDIASFAREFHANVDREGLIIDVRRNRGGNIDSWVINTLLRRAWAFWQPPNHPPYWNMQQSFRGHVVVLADALTYSDGETFSAGIKTLGLGPLIGQRTAGAGVWLSDSNRLVDRGVMRAAQMGQFDQQGRWLIEGRGVSPDIEVDNLPHATWRGEDAQLARGITELLQRLQAQPVVQPPAQVVPPRGQNGADAVRQR